MSAPRILILGRGKLGRSLAGALAAADVPVALAAGRAVTGDAADFEHRDLVVLAVPDGSIMETAAALVGCGAPPHTAFIHLSGACGLDALAPLSCAGYECGSFHPFQPFPAERPAEAFHGTTVGISADSTELEDRLSELAVRIGSTPRPVPDDFRGIYHAAAVLASSCVVALAGQAARLLEEMGWTPDEATSALVPLMEGTVANIAANGLPDALSGPLRRGDSETAARHIEALEELASTGDAADILASYRTLGHAALRQARELGLADADAAKVARLLDQPARA